MRRERSVAWGLVGLFVGALGCGELRDLWDFRQALAAEYGAGGVHLGIEAGVRTLSLRLEEPELLALPWEEKAELAREVARFASDHYARGDRVDRYAVEFVDERGFGPIAWNRRVTFDFTPGELR